MSGREQTPELKFIGSALMAVGGLVAALCGTCTLVLVGTAIVDSYRHPGDLVSALLLFAAVGGLPTLIGLLIFRWGRSIWRPKPNSRPRNLAVFSDEPDERP